MDKNVYALTPEDSSLLRETLIASVTLFKLVNQLWKLARFSEELARSVTRKMRYYPILNATRYRTNRRKSRCAFSR